MTTAPFAPDYVEPFEAWRVWRVVRHHGELMLASIVKRTLWPAGEPFAAECLKALPLFDWLRRRRPHAAPELACECGIYGGTLDCVRGYLSDSLPEAETRVIGRVGLWGCVVECERGYRASYAYPVSLCVPTSRRDRAAAEEVATGLEHYGVRVEVLPEGRFDPAQLTRVLS